MNEYIGPQDTEMLESEPKPDLADVCELIKCPIFNLSLLSQQTELMEALREEV